MAGSFMGAFLPLPSALQACFALPNGTEHDSFLSGGKDSRPQRLKLKTLLKTQEIKRTRQQTQEPGQLTWQSVITGNGG